MAQQNVFEKIHVDERDKADLGGVLEQLNLPPSVVDFVRKNQKAIYIVLGIISVIVVVWSFYGSYVESKINKSSSALAQAMKVEDDKKIDALGKVISDFSGTQSALWAKVEIAQIQINDKKYEESLQVYNEVRKEIKQENPLYPLVTFGIAQAEEALQNYQPAVTAYTTLKTITGYEDIGYNGIARLYEVQQKYEEAIKELEEYLGVLMSDEQTSQEKEYISVKINRLKAIQ